MQFKIKPMLFAFVLVAPTAFAIQNYEDYVNRDVNVDCGACGWGPARITAAETAVNLNLQQGDTVTVISKYGIWTFTVCGSAASLVVEPGATGCH